ncbi:MAG: HNH endonuclease [Methanocorpusculum sp.]|nr:HNH endonuclease [Methanocorpusculum sp.]MBQ9831079.1 HNH endonuclease [Methanocorpusculum sp.]
MAKTDNLIRSTDFAVYLKGMRGDWVAHPDTGRIYSNSIGDFLKPSVKAGYPSLRIRLSFGDKEICGRVSVHRAMWVLCRGIPLSLDAEVDHIDHNRENNRLENLRLISKQENVPHQITYADAEEIRRKREDGNTLKALAEEYGISQSSVRNIIRRKTHKNPPKVMYSGRL